MTAAPLQNQDSPFFDIIKDLIHKLFSHVLYFCMLNLLWFLALFLIPAKLLFSGYMLAGALAFFFLLTLASSLCYLQTARIKNEDSLERLSLSERFLTVWGIVIFWFFLLGFFSFNSLFYYATLASQKTTILNASFFFFSLWLVFMTTGLGLYWVPLSMKENSLKKIIHQGLYLYFKNLPSSLALTLAILCLSAFSLLFLFFLFMPIHSLALFYLFEYTRKKAGH